MLVGEACAEFEWHSAYQPDTLLLTSGFLP